MRLGDEQAVEWVTMQCWQMGDRKRVRMLNGDRASEADRAIVAAEMRALLERSKLSRTEFARRIGTSAPRLSTHLSGKVVPSAALIVRMGNLVERVAGAGASVRWSSELAETGRRV